MFRKQDTSASRETLPGIILEPLAWGERASMTKFHLAQGSSIPLHSHPHEQIGCLVSGHVTFLVGDDEIDTVPGDSWAFAGGEPHGVKVLEDAIIIEVFAPVREEYLPD